jgi:mannose-6-phosphate isomerase class I
LHGELAGDPGVFGPFFLNVVALAPGEAIYCNLAIVPALEG